MAHKERTLAPDLERTVVSLRVAGMSERAIYETARGSLREAPSYRDLRAAFDRAGVSTRALARAAREQGSFPEARVERRQEATDYRGRLRTSREVVAKEDRTEAKRLLDRQFLLGYLARQGFDAEGLEDEGLRESLESIYDGLGS